MTSGGGSEFGITFPNAKCPVCGESVFFFQARDGGRVFFDPPLGPPWPKHPCTVREPELAARANVGEVESDEAYSAAPIQESYTVEIFPRPNNSVVVLDADGEEIAYATDLKLDQRYLDRVWPVKNDREKVVGLSFLTANFDPVEVSAKPRALVGAMGAGIRRELSRMASAKLEGIVRRMGDAVAELSIAETKYGMFGSVDAGPSRLVLIPVPIEHRISLDEDDAKSTLDYMFEAAEAALENCGSRSPTRPDVLHLNRIVFVFEDVLGRVKDFIARGLDFEPEGHFDTTARSWSSNPLSQIRARIMWVDVFDEGRIELPECAMTIDEAFEAEADFCSEIWPEDNIGRWAKVRAIIEALGHTQRFMEINAALKGIGWRINHRGEHYQRFKHEIEYVPPERDPDDDTPRVRLLFSKSDPTSGIGMAMGRFSDASLLKDVFIRISDADALTKVVRKLRRMK
ncbi:MAG: hypothetical protein M9945_17345 [Aquamicrobium sp.]|uniref:hypothetical protein n=1 Tax=Aquamicrobium sp. TaxID=1872579 RepID=UPI00349ED3A2|nr:hypothetical protein [Aquamicrobium sp.]